MEPQSQLEEPKRQLRGSQRQREGLRGSWRASVVVQRALEAVERPSERVRVGQYAKTQQIKGHCLVVYGTLLHPVLFTFLKSVHPGNYTRIFNTDLDKYFSINTIVKYIKYYFKT